MELEASSWVIPTSIFLISFLLMITKFTKQTQIKNKKHKIFPPSPPAIPMIGHIDLIKQPLHRTLDKLTQKYGDIIFLKLGTRNVLAVSSPSGVEECLTKNDIIFANRPRTLAAKHLNYNSMTVGFSSYGDHWRNLRRLTTLELFSSNRLAMFTTVREQEVQLVVKQIFQDCKGKLSTVNLRERLVELSFNIMLRVISGKRYYGQHAVAQEGKEFQMLMKEFAELQGNENLIDFFPILKLIDFKGMTKKMVKMMNKMDNFLQMLVDEHERNRAITEVKDPKHMTLIDVMLDLRQTEPEFYTNETVKGVILSMLVAGAETSATTLEWGMALLLNHPKVLNKVKVEIQTHVTHQDQLLNESDSMKLTYLHNVITETLRLYPVAPLLIPHESAIDCKVCGYDIPQGTMLLVNLWTLQRHPDVWADPTRFMPERFEGGACGEVYNMIPFGLGRRACPGAVMAKRFMGHALGALIQSFEWDRIGEDEINMEDGVGLTMPKVEPLVALCRPRQEMIQALSKI
ncbi:PREDICTED: isoflavone 2'-hydroxylase-like [Lupinus angustifolius]|nr:PREDICTED: isoflavone 2'-hydroxylase-like [Lupinus angustifolius]